MRDLDYILAQALVHSAGMTPKSAAARAMQPYIRLEGRKRPVHPSDKRVVNGRTISEAIQLTPQPHRYWRPSFNETRGLDRPYGRDARSESRDQ